MSPSVAELEMMHAARRSIIEAHANTIVNGLLRQITFTLDKLIDESLAEDWPASITDNRLEGVISPHLKSEVYHGLSMALDRKREGQLVLANQAFQARTA